MEASGEPVSQGEVTARIVAPSGKSQFLRFSTIGDEWGAFAATYVTKEAGSHQVTLTCKETKASLTTTLFVQGNVIERIGKPARPEVLEELARVSRGKVLGLNQIDEIIQTLAALPEPPATIRRVQLWSHPLMAGGFILLLGVFWVGRKLAGLM
jgi:hypothetical protein